MLKKKNTKAIIKRKTKLAEIEREGNRESKRAGEKRDRDQRHERAEPDTSSGRPLIRKGVEPIQQKHTHTYTHTHTHTVKDPESKLPLQSA